MAKGLSTDGPWAEGMVKINTEVADFEEKFTPGGPSRFCGRGLFHLGSLWSALPERMVPSQMPGERQDPVASVTSAHVDAADLGFFKARGYG